MSYTTAARDPPSIRNIIINPMYRGVLRSGETVTEPFEHLRIIEDATFFRSQELARQRSKKHREERHVPITTSGECLLGGNIYCGHRGARLISSTAGRKYTRKDDTVYQRRYWRYNCCNRTRAKGKCSGKSGYTADKIDKVVDESIGELLAQLGKVSVTDIVERRYKNETEKL